MERYRFTITSSRDEVDALVAQTGDHCELRAGGALADSLRLCLAEALNNVIRHAYGGMAGLPIRVWLVLRGRGYGATIADRGCPMPGGRLPPGPVAFDARRVDALPEGGFGWLLIRAEVDRLAYRRLCGTNVLWFGRSALD